MRRRGRSLKEIADQLNISKGTASGWCRDIELTPKQIQSLENKRKEAGYRGSVIAAEKKRKVRLIEEVALRKEGLEEVGKISKRDLFVAGIAFYWSEGYTYLSDDQVGFVNSDPKMVLLMLSWFKEICNVREDRFRFAVRINHAHRMRVKEVERYWSRLTSAPLSKFNKTILIKSTSKKVYPQSKPYYGTLRITILRGTRLRRKINGWLDGLAIAGE